VPRMHGENHVLQWLIGRGIVHITLCPRHLRNPVLHAIDSANLLPVSGQFLLHWEQIHGQMHCFLQPRIRRNHPVHKRDQPPVLQVSHAPNT